MLWRTHPPLEDFYPSPFQSTRFVYLFGTTMLKVGGGGVKTFLPLASDARRILSLTDEPTVIVPIDRVPSLSSNRDYYRLGIGATLLELLRPRTSPYAAATSTNQ